VKLKTKSEQREWPKDICEKSAVYIIYTGACASSFENESLLASYPGSLGEGGKCLRQGIYEGKDVFLWLSTGFGKSVCTALRV